MKRDNTPWRPLEPASLQWNEAGDPVSTRYGDVYYSQDDGLEESRYVFLQGNDLPRRWSLHPRPHFCICETGFGTGLNFLLTWQAWAELAQPRPALHYLSIEKHPMSRDDLTRALGNWPSLQVLAAPLLDNYPGLVPGQHRLLFAQGQVTLDLWWEDVQNALPDLASRDQPFVDAWYFDGFAPARNEAMWSTPALRAAAALSQPGASFATFTAAGQVRRDLAEAGFTVHRAPGFGRKRECLRGQIEQAGSTVTTIDTPWDLVAARRTRPQSALVIGGGLAGCTAAAALARRGIAVTLLDKGKIASAGSGNDQGILYTRLSRKHSALTDFALQSFLFASHYYRDMLQSGQLSEGLDGALCGSFHQTDKVGELAAMAEVLTGVPELAQVLNATQAQEMLGITQCSSGFWYPQSGWLRPASVCQALIAGGGITVMEDCGNLSLDAANDEWRAVDGKQVMATADCAIVATGTAATDMPALDWLPLQAIRGQTTQLPTTPVFDKLRSALCHKGYIAPARLGLHCIGATFNLHDDDPNLRSADHHSNLAGLAAAVPGWSESLTALDPAALDGRVGYRCASPDYLPMTGPVPNRSGFLHDYAQLRKNARQTIAAKGDYMPGLYVTTAHGSRGLTSAPLAAELLASMICDEALPLSRELVRALAPARFIMRDLARNRI